MRKSHPVRERQIGRKALVILATLGLAACGKIEARRELKAGNSAYAEGRFAKAIEHYEQVSKAYPDGARAALNSGYAYWKQYRFGSQHPVDRELALKGVEAFERYMTLRPAEAKDSNDFPGAGAIRERVITLLIDSERFEEAISRLESDLEARPNDAALLRGIATAYDKWGKPTRAVHYYQRWSGEFPDDASPHVAIAAYAWNISYRRNQELEPLERNRWIDVGLAAADAALHVDSDHFEGLTYKNLLLRERAKMRTSPDGVAMLLREANENLAKAKVIREKQKAIEEAAKAAQDKKEQEAAAAKGDTSS